MTHHMDVRMNQRGMSAELVNLALTLGDWEGDKCKLDRKILDQRLLELDRERGLLLKARDKGGLVVVEAEGHLITTYRVPKSKRGRS